MRQRVVGALAAAPPNRRLLIALGAALMAMVVAVPTIVLAHTDAAHPTAVTVECDEASVLHGASVECMVTVVDEEGDALERSNPLGTVTFSSSLDGSLGACALEAVAGSDDTSTCSQTITLSGAAGQHVISASYAEQQVGDHLWAAGEGTTPLTVIGGSIVIEKLTPTGVGSFEFSGDLGDFTLTTATQGQPVSEVFANLVPGEYAVTEDAAPGWQIQDISCTGGGASEVTIGDGNGTGGASTVTIDIVAGEAVTCTFGNTNLGTVTVIQETEEGDGTFGFTSDLPGGNFSLTTEDGEAEHVVNTAVAGVTYQVTATEVAALADIACSATDGAFVVNGATVTLSLSAGGSVTCTFTSAVVDAEVQQQETGERGCPAAPAIAAAYLKEIGVRAGGPFVPNIVAGVAQSMEARAHFDGLDKCDEGYEEAVRDFVDEQIEARDELEVAQAGSGGGNANAGGGRPPWAGGPTR